MVRSYAAVKCSYDDHRPIQHTVQKYYQNVSSETIERYDLVESIVTEIKNQDFPQDVSVCRLGFTAFRRLGLVIGCPRGSGGKAPLAESATRSHVCRGKQGSMLESPVVA